MVKLHNAQHNGIVDQLSFRPIISNIGTATYDLAKHLAQLPKQLRKSQYIIKNSKSIVSTMIRSFFQIQNFII